MTNDVATRLRAARIARGFETAADAARAFGWSVSTYTSHENGTRGIKRDAAERYARAYRMPLAQLLGLADTTPIVQTVPIIAAAQYGIWRDASMYLDQDDRLPDDSVTIPNGGPVGVFGVRIEDDSVNKALPAGSVAICRPATTDDLKSLKSGMFVLVRRAQGQLVETTVRRVSARDGDTVTLATHSTHGRYQQMIEIAIDGTTTDAELLGIVSALYTSLEN